MQFKLLYMPVLLMAALWTAAADEVPVQGQGKPGVLLLKGAVVHTPEDAPLTNGQVLIVGGKIHSVLKADAAPGMTPDAVMDLTGLHLFPGLIALNTSLGLSEISAIRSTRDFSEKGDFTPDVQSWIAVNPDSELLPVARANGVACIQPAPQGGIVAGQSGLVVLDGWTTEQMTFKAPASLHVYWPDPVLDTTPKEKSADPGKFKSLEEQALARKKKLKSLEDFFGEARAYLKTKTHAAVPPPEVPAWEAMIPFVQGTLPVMVHANDARQIRDAVLWADTNRIRIVIAGARDALRVADLLAQKQVPVLFEHIFSVPEKDTDAYDVYYKTPALLHQRGVKTAIGMGATAFDAGLIKNLPHHAAQAAAYGLPETEALRAITLHPAMFLGVDDHLGSIAPGKDATLFAADRSILDIRAGVRHMWISGRKTDLQSRHSRLYEKYKNRPPSRSH